MRRAFLLLALVAAMWGCTVPQSKPADVSTLAGVPEGRWIWIELDYKRLTLYEGMRAVNSYPIASGAWDTPSPLGVFYINGRFQTELSGFGTRYLNLSVPWGKYGIHGTNRPESIGSNASHGCIRLRVKDAEALYAQVPNGARVVITGGPYGLLGDGLRPLKPGDRCSHVALVQTRLCQLGFYYGSADGVYGVSTSRAVVAARKDFGLSYEDVVDYALYTRLGILLFE